MKECTEWKIPKLELRDVVEIELVMRLLNKVFRPRNLLFLVLFVLVVVAVFYYQTSKLKLIAKLL